MSAIQRYTVRELCLQDASAFRAIRLYALKTEGDLLGPTYESEVVLPYEEWEKRVTPSDTTRCFGLFDGKDLIGVMRATSWDGDMSGSTALWGQAYLKREYRNKGLAKDLYKARESWTRANPLYTNAVMFIRQDNFRSIAIHLQNGAEFMQSRAMSWDNREPAIWNWYRVSLTSVEQAIAALETCFPETLGIRSDPNQTSHPPSELKQA